VTANLRERQRKYRQRIQVRAWELRQSRHAKGTWERLRLLLAMSESAHAIDDEEMDVLAGSFRLEPAGLALHPQKRIVVLSPVEVEGLRSKRSLRVALGIDLLAARNVVLTRFAVGES
jgi:hypothetical protein